MYSVKLVIFLTIGCALALVFGSDCDCDEVNACVEEKADQVAEELFSSFVECAAEDECLSKLGGNFSGDVEQLYRCKALQDDFSDYDKCRLGYVEMGCKADENSDGDDMLSIRYFTKLYQRQFGETFWSASDDFKNQAGILRSMWGVRKVLEHEECVEKKCSKTLNDALEAVRSKHGNVVDSKGKMQRIGFIEACRREMKCGDQNRVTWARVNCLSKEEKKEYQGGMWSACMCMQQLGFGHLKCNKLTKLRTPITQWKKSTSQQPHKSLRQKGRAKKRNKKVRNNKRKTTTPKPRRTTTRRRSNSRRNTTQRPKRGFMKKMFNTVKGSVKFGVHIHG